jgi:regulator of replication initiation timing
MEFFEFLQNTYQSAIQNPFVLGLLLGLMFAAFIWKNGFTARRHALGELKRVQTDLRELQGHLNTQLKINATGIESLKAELESLRRQNETLRVNLSALHQKPGRAEQRLMQIHESAVRTMREQAPGFAPAWEKALRQAEGELEAADSGLRRLVRRVIPSLGNSSNAGTPATVVVSDDHEQSPTNGQPPTQGQ